MQLIFDMTELGIDIFEIYLIFHFLLDFKIKLSKFLIFLIILSEFGIICLNFFDLENIIRSIYMILVPTIVNLFSEKSIHKHHIVYALFSTTLVGTIQSLTLNTIRTGGRLINQNFNKIFSGSLVLLTTVLLWLTITYYITHHRYGLLHKRRTSFFIFISLVALFNASVYSVFIYCVNNLGIELYDHTKLIEWFLFFFGIALIAEIIYIIFLYYEKTHYSIISDFTQEFLEIERAHFQEQRKQETDTRTFRHDIENHLSVMNHHAQQGNTEKLIQYLQSLNTSFTALKCKYHTANETINGILNQASQELEKNSISLSIDGNLKAFEVIDDFDLCTIFSNALHNSIEACMKITEPSKRYIMIHFRSQGNLYIIHFSNAVAENIKLKDNRPATSKSDKKNHGFGLIQIEHITHNYNGNLYLTCEDNVFNLTVQLTK